MKEIQKWRSGKFKVTNRRRFWQTGPDPVRSVRTISDECSSTKHGFDEAMKTIYSQNKCGLGSFSFCRSDYGTNRTEWILVQIWVSVQVSECLMEMFQQFWSYKRQQNVPDPLLIHMEALSHHICSCCHGLRSAPSPVHSKTCPLTSSVSSTATSGTHPVSWGTPLASIKLAESGESTVPCL